MNYQKHYNMLISKRGLKVKPEDSVYYEKHHVLPRSLGGSDNKDNLVYLTGREHFVAHWLLWKIHKNGPMASAFFAMSMKNNPRRDYRVTARIYELAKSAHNENWVPFISQFIKRKEKVDGPIVCTVCGKTGHSWANMLRWHFDNCGKPREVSINAFYKNCEHCKRACSKTVYYKYHGDSCRILTLQLESKNCKHCNNIFSPGNHSRHEAVCLLGSYRRCSKCELDVHTTNYSRHTKTCTATTPAAFKLCKCGLQLSAISYSKHLKNCTGKSNELS